MRRASILFGLLAVTACGSPTSTEGTCIAVVNVDGVFYGDAPDPRPTPAEVSSEPYLEITRNTGCLDQGEQADPLGHGESNFLEVGTTLHRIEGYEPGERLAHWAPVIGEWLALSPLPDELGFSPR